MGARRDLTLVVAICLSVASARAQAPQTCLNNQNPGICDLADAPYSYPNDIVAGPDGAMWFTNGLGYIGRIDMLGTITTYTIPFAGTYPTYIAVGSDKNIWFSDQGTNSIGRILVAKPDSNTIQEVAAPGAGIQRLTPGPDGEIWFT